MNNTVQKLSKIDTRNLLRHAAALSSTGAVANMIDVEPSRVSEGKKGNWQLPREKADKLREKFGTPLAEPGLYLECEVWDTLEELKAESDRVARWRQWQRIKTVADCPEMQSILASLIGSDQGSGCATVRDDLGSLLQDDEFVSWYQNRKRALLDVKADKESWYRNGALLSLSPKVFLEGELKITGILESNGLMPQLEWHRDRLIEHTLTLILLAELACHRQDISELAQLPEDNFQPFVTSWPNIEAPERAHPQETVVTGDIIWRERVWIEPLMRTEAVLPLENLPEMTGWLDSNDTKLIWLTSILPDRYNHLDLQVAMTPNLNYHLVLTLSLQRAICSSSHMKEYRLSADLESNELFVEWVPARQMVIREVKSERLFNVINQIHDWLGLTPPETYSLKQEIAKYGGYLSGVLYLE